jgi:hypothetical protein
MSPEQFPQLQAAVRNSAKFDEAVWIIETGLEGHPIRNVVLNEVKRTLSSAVTEGWSKYVQEPFFNGGRYASQPQAVVDLENSIMILSLHDVLATSRKLAKTQASGPAVEAMRAFVAEALPLAEAVTAIKDRVIKGRAPSTGRTQPANPNKIVKTCPICFRAIAVTRRGTMAHHGYERPGSGWQTASCPGTRFKPLEVSPAGLEWFIGALRGELSETQSAYRNRNTLTSLVIFRNRKKITFSKDCPQWAREFELHTVRLEAQILSLQRELSARERRLREWQPELA